MNKNMKKLMEENFQLDITRFFKIAGLKKAYIQLVEYDKKYDEWEVCNCRLKNKEEVAELLENKVFNIEESLNANHLTLDDEDIFLVFEGIDGKDKTIKIQSSEWLNINLL